MHLYSTHISHDFEHNTGEHSDHESPSSNLVAKEEVSSEEDGEDG